MIFLREATPSDAPTIRQLAHTTWWEHYPEIITPEQITYMLERMYSDGALLKQMEEGQVFRLIEPEQGEPPIGFVAVSDKGVGAYFLHKFYIANAGKRKGLGSVVFRHLLEIHPDLREMRLTVNRRNYRSINFYFKNGFIIEKNVDIEIGNGFVMDDFQMLFKR